ncbi:MAG: hypothetical protein SNJ71_00400 [Bacteroidales bacterium]
MELKDLIDNYWLGLDETTIKHIYDGNYPPIFTPDDNYYRENPDEFLLKVLRKNLYLAAKYLLNVNLLPFQLVILDELWHRKYPMLIAARGTGKCVTGNTLLVTDRGFSYIKDLIKTDETQVPVFVKEKVLNSQGSFVDVEYGWVNGIEPIYSVESENGYLIEGTADHPILVLSDKKAVSDNINYTNITWKKLRDIEDGDYVLIDTRRNWHLGKLNIEDAEERGGTGKIFKELFYANQDSFRRFLCGLFRKRSKILNKKLFLYPHDLPSSELLHFGLTRFGIFSKIVRDNHPHIILEGDNFSYFVSEILKEKEKLKFYNAPFKPLMQFNYYFDSVKVLRKKILTNTYDLHLYDSSHNFITNGIISHNSFILGLYVLLRSLFNQGSKIVIVGGGFRQAKLVFEYAERLLQNAPIFQDLLGEPVKPYRGNDLFRLNIGSSSIIAIPIGDGSKIRGLRATHIVADEFASINESIYEVVISGFASVSSDPVKNMQKIAKLRAIEKFGLNAGFNVDDLLGMGNQSIVAGTASYDKLNAFSKYWHRYKSIILSKGDKNQLYKIFGEDCDKINWKDYSIIRLPVHLLPEGYMDEKNVLRAKATVHSGIFDMEYGSVFVSDSRGFFKRSVIESCVTKEPILVNGEWVQFHVNVKGNKLSNHVMGVDPASESDNLAIVILELAKNHRRVVYCWSTNIKEHRKVLESGMTKETDYYSYCARKIRDLNKLFPCVRIGIDKQGGGVALKEVLHDVNKLLPDEQPFWEIMEDGKEKDSDRFRGEHIIELINFSNAEWVSSANHGLRHDMETKTLLFPYYDTLSIEIAHYSGSSNNFYDPLDLIMQEIEDLKNELSTIVHTHTGVIGRDRWDLPVKMGGDKRGVLKKDRYTALLIANAIARNLQESDNIPTFSNPIGGFAGTIVETEEPYNPPPWWNKMGISDFSGIVVGEEN